MRRLSQNEWIDGAFVALTEGGIDALRVEPLAKRLGVTKGSFYHHFDNRRALHVALLDTWEALGTGQIIDEVTAAQTDPADRLRALAARTFAVDPFADSIETAVRAWAANDDTAAAATERVDARRLAFVVGLLRDAGLPRAKAERRARLMYRVLIGEFVWRTTGGPASTRRELDDMVDLLLADL